PTASLVISQVVLSFGIPFALVPLALLTRRADIMGPLVNHRLTTAAAAYVTALVVTLNGYLRYLTATGQGQREAGLGPAPRNGTRAARGRRSYRPRSRRCAFSPGRKLPGTRRSRACSSVWSSPAATPRTGSSKRSGGRPKRTWSGWRRRTGTSAKTAPA